MVFRGLHQQLRPVVQAGNAPEGVQQRQSQFVLAEVLPAQPKIPTLVVVVRKGHESIRILVQVISGQGLVELAHAFVPARRLGDGFLQGKVGLKIGDGIQTVVRRPKGKAAGKIGLALVVVHPGFAKQDHARVVGAHHLVEAGHEVLVGVGVRVYAQRVNAGLLNPPQGVLNQVVGSVFVLQIPVRHGVVEPAAFKKVLISLGGVGVKKCGFAVVGARVLLFGVEPGGIRLRLVEVVLVSGVVVHHVHHVLHAAFVQGVGQSQEVCVGPKARIHQVVVRDGVPVVGGAHLVVGQPGVDPNGRNAQGLNVVQMLFNARQIATVAVVRLLAVQTHLQLSVHAVVLGVAVGKPVRRDQVHLVRRVQPHELAFGGVARLQGVSEIQGSRQGRHGKGQVHRFRVGVQPEHNL